MGGLKNEIVSITNSNADVDCISEIASPELKKKSYNRKKTRPNTIKGDRSCRNSSKKVSIGNNSPNDRQKKKSFRKSYKKERSIKFEFES